jgi:hypothetical protein
MQLNQSRLFDLFAQELRRSALTDFLSNMRALPSSFCAKIRIAAASLSTAWSRRATLSANTFASWRMTKLLLLFFVRSGSLCKSPMLCPSK